MLLKTEQKCVPGEGIIGFTQGTQLDSLISDRLLQILTFESDIQRVPIN